MISRRHLTSISTVASGLLLVAWLATDLNPSAARRRKRRRKKRRPPPTKVERELRDVGNPKVVVVRRRNVKAFADAARAYRKLSLFPTGKVVFDADTPKRDLLEDVEDAKPKVVLAFGPGAAAALAGGLADVPVVFAHLSRRPATTVRHGGSLVHGPTPRSVLGWIHRLRKEAGRVAVIVRNKDGDLAEQFRSACRAVGVKPVVLVATSPGDVVRAVAAMLPRRPAALWLGWDVELYPRAVIEQLVRLQALFRLPVIGVTTEHVRQGLALAVDGSPAAVGRAAQELIRKHVGSWLLPSRRTPTSGRSRRRRLRAKPRASQLVHGVVVPDRISVNARTARVLGVDLAPLLAAGAVKVAP